MQALCNILPDIVAWALILGGWIIVHKLSLGRDRRKEKRAVADDVIKKIHDLENMAIRFHSSESFDWIKASELRLQIDRLIKSIQRAPMNELKVPMRTLVSLRQAYTRKNFDLSDFSSQSNGSDILRNINSSSDDLIDLIEVSKHEHWT